MADIIVKSNRKIFERILIMPNPVGQALLGLGQTFRGIGQDIAAQRQAEAQQQYEMARLGLAREQQQAQFGLEKQKMDYEQWRKTPMPVYSILAKSPKLAKNPQAQRRMLEMADEYFMGRPFGEHVTTPELLTNMWQTFNMKDSPERQKKMEKLNLDISMMRKKLAQPTEQWRPLAGGLGFYEPGTMEVRQGPEWLRKQITAMKMPKRIGGGPGIKKMSEADKQALKYAYDQISQIDESLRSIGLPDPVLGEPITYPEEKIVAMQNEKERYQDEINRINSGATRGQWSQVNTKIVIDDAKRSGWFDDKASVESEGTRLYNFYGPPAYNEFMREITAMNKEETKKRGPLGPTRQQYLRATEKLIPAHEPPVEPPVEPPMGLTQRALESAFPSGTTEHEIMVRRPLEFWGPSFLTPEEYQRRQGLIK